MLISVTPLQNSESEMCHVMSITNGGVRLFFSLEQVTKTFHFSAHLPVTFSVRNFRGNCEIKTEDFCEIFDQKLAIDLRFDFRGISLKFRWKFVQDVKNVTRNLKIISVRPPPILDDHRHSIFFDDRKPVYNEANSVLEETVGRSTHSDGSTAMCMHDSEVSLFLDLWKF